MLYIDLDTVVVGALDELATFGGAFGTLATDGMVNERRAGGYNSSVMMWTAGEFVMGDAPWTYTGNGSDAARGPAFWAEAEVDQTSAAARPEGAAGLTAFWAAAVVAAAVARSQ